MPVPNGSDHGSSIRQCGVLLHPTALPGTPGCGSFGLEARQWIDQLAAAGIAAWQLLPLAPTDGTGSPYSSPSGFALNPWFLDAQVLVDEGFLESTDADGLPVGSRERLDLEVAPQRAAALGQRLLERWPAQSPEHRQAFAHWCRQESAWLRDHCRFMVLRQRFAQQPWWTWPGPLARRGRLALRRLDRQEAAPLLQEALLQWQLQRQWHHLREHASACGVRLIGDLPFYVAHDSADVWANRRLFSVRPDGSLREQSGVPPDYFSDTGQLWGTPVYRWSLHRLTGFRWWMRRLERQLQLLDLLRLDHFRALESYWSVPGQAKTAQEGHWRPSPGEALLTCLQARWRRQRPVDAGAAAALPLIAEDLGVITPEVEALRDRFALPGMKILQFAFDGNDDNSYLPANYDGDHWVVYTGTHDNATCMSWWQQLEEDQRRQVGELVGSTVDAPGWQLLELALGSSAQLAVVPLQDLLHLDDQARFNTPGTASGNWTWRLNQSIESLQGPLEGLQTLAERYRRTGTAAPEPVPGGSL
ncbi:4-alpha-glucanotransferase [Synechococcus sp. BSF8S]|uniref:4-alpha-glucanotransferase n=1 Tax=Synechococcales TaxID=1890424 RepID=UPI001625598D|nr:MULTISPECIES: 4-alpha-glucanotransferase [unclassified Synechococcus]MBC1260019.1 4-alpha-glucanotransferase [Synechococcus sp. BSF8S]MBC1263164.1 4-alpha-glucanotransferase [Synechococcus sp. BSA11S]